MYQLTTSESCSLTVVERDTKERGRALEHILSQYTELVKPAFEEFTLPVRPCTPQCSSVHVTSSWKKGQLLPQSRSCCALHACVWFSFVICRQRSMQMSLFPEGWRTEVCVCVVVVVCTGVHANMHTCECVCASVCACMCACVSDSMCLYVPTRAK